MVMNRLSFTKRFFSCRWCSRRKCTQTLRVLIVGGGKGLISPNLPFVDQIVRKQHLQWELGGQRNISSLWQKESWEFLLPALWQRWEVKAGQNCNQMVDANVQSQNWSHHGERCGFKRLCRQTAAVMPTRHIHPVHPFVVRACSQHLYQITLMHRKNLFFCSSTPDGPVYSVWDWRLNPSELMSLHFNKTATFRSPVHFMRSTTWIGAGTEVL